MIVYSTAQQNVEQTLEALTLKHFNGVLSDGTEAGDFYVSKNGYFIPSGAMYVKDEIVAYYDGLKGSSKDINKTFHKSWQKVATASQEQLLIEQLVHYITTYGTNFTTEAFIPTEKFDLPVDLTFKAVQAYEKMEIFNKMVSVISSGIAMKQETIEDFVLIFKLIGMSIPQSILSKNKEAEVIISAKLGLVPTNTSQFVRMLVYKATGSTLVIKNFATTLAIKGSTYNPTKDIKAFGTEKLAESFNRYKTLLLAFKPRAAKVINRVAKLSKKLHKPMQQNPMNQLTQEVIGQDAALTNATTPALIRAIGTLSARIAGQDSFIYRVRNGKSFAKAQPIQQNLSVIESNYATLLAELKTRVSFEGKTVYIPAGVEYGIPTSEKQMVGVIPEGTKFTADRLAVGIYWENAWGARDLDLSATAAKGEHVGWNGAYAEDGLYYSGDITNAPNGAAEYLYASKQLDTPYIVKNNVYSGVENTRFNIIIGEGDHIDMNYMMDPNKLFAQAEATTSTRQQTLGVLVPEAGKQTFILAYNGDGNSRRRRRKHWT